MELLLDNCVVNKLAEDGSIFNLFIRLKEFGYADFNVCFSTIEELVQTPDKCKEKRIRALDLLLLLEPRFFSDSVSIFDKTRFDASTFSDGEVYKEILKVSKNNVKDAICAQTAVSNGLALVTEDKQLYNTMKRYGHQVYMIDELKNSDIFKQEIYPISSQEYVEGFVCYFDILGFGKFSMDINNLSKIQKAVIGIQAIKRMHEMNGILGDIIIFSDSVFFTVKNEEMKEASFFTSIVSFVSLARDIVQTNIGTDIRAGIAYGKYIHLKTGEIYGPAITQSVRLAEPKKDGDQLKAFLDGDPAAIIVHENVFDAPINAFSELTRLFEEQNKRFSRIGDTNYFLVNPYYFIYETKIITSMLFGKTNDKKEMCNTWRNIIKSNEQYSSKYKLSLTALDSFESDDSIE